MQDSMIELVRPQSDECGGARAGGGRAFEARLRHSTRVPLLVETDLLDVASLMRRIEPAFQIDVAEGDDSRLAFWQPLFDDRAATKEPLRFNQLFEMFKTWADRGALLRDDAPPVADNAILFTALPLKLAHLLISKTPGGKLFGDRSGASVHLLPPLARHTVLDRLICS